MAKEQETQSNQLNLTVVALVALVAIVGLVALVMNAASVGKTVRLATGSETVSAATSRTNIGGQAIKKGSSTVKASYNVVFDYNNDGIVNADDASILTTAVLAQPLSNKNYDTNGDGVHTSSDIFWLANKYSAEPSYYNVAFDYDSNGDLQNGDATKLTSYIYEYLPVCTGAKDCDVNNDGALSTSDVFALTGYYS